MRGWPWMALRRVAPAAVWALVCLVPALAYARVGSLPAKVTMFGLIVGTIVTILTLPYLLLRMWRWMCQVRRKRREAREVLRRIGDDDPAWSEAAILRRARRVYEDIQDAWTAGDAERVRDLFTEDAFRIFRRELEHLRQRLRTNIIDKITFRDITIVEVQDYEDDDKDSVWVLFEGEMIDYLASTRSGRVFSGSETEPRAFADLWRFVRGKGNQWVVAHMEADCALEHLKRLHSFTELPARDSGWLAWWRA